MGVAELEEEKNDPVRPGFPELLNQVTAPAEQPMMFGRANNAIYISPGDVFDHVALNPDVSLEKPVPGAHIFSDDNGSGRFNDGIDIRYIADPSRKNDAFSLKRAGRRLFC